MSNESVEYLKNEIIAQQLKAGPVYIKSAETGLRLPKSQEVGTEFVTYVKHGDGIRVESNTPIIKECVIARNKNIIGKNDKQENVYNEWPIPMATAIKNYGQEVIDGLQSDIFTYHKKKATVSAIELTPFVMQQLGLSGDTLNIKVSWSPEPMVAKLGDYLTSGGYSISQHDMKDYEPV